MSALWEVRRSHDPLPIPGKVLGAVRAMSLDEAQRIAASRWPGVLLRVSPQSDTAARIEKALRRLGRVPSPVRYETRGEP